MFSFYRCTHPYLTGNIFLGVSETNVNSQDFLGYGCSGYGKWYIQEEQAHYRKNIFKTNLDIVCLPVLFLNSGCIVYRYCTVLPTPKNIFFIEQLGNN
jgi:hypothetical protein